MIRKQPHQNTTPFKRKGRNKDTARKTQLQTIFTYLQKHATTASMLSEATGVPQKNICRYKRDLEQSGRLWEVKKVYCPLTGHKAWIITTDPKKAPKNTPHQLEIFHADGTKK